MISGFLNEKLLPIIPGSLMKTDGDWQDLCVLLDTGSEFGFMLPENTIRTHNIDTRWSRDFPTFIEPTLRLENSKSMPPRWIELQLEENTREVEAKIITDDEFHGVIGPSLLLDRRITINVEKCGAVEIDWIPPPTLLDRIRSLIRKPERQRPSFDYIWKLPWVNVAVKDSEGKRQCFSANVDTGDSGQLSLPPSYVERFGLELPGKCQVRTPDGLLDASCGEAEMFWQGSPCTVKCVQHQEEKPPLIGIKLLRGNRITIDIDVDLDYLPPVVEIARIPTSTSSKENFLQSSWDRLRRL